MPALSGSQKALMYAQSGVMRSGASRSGYHSPKVFVAIDAVQRATARATATQYVEEGTLSINDILDETPNQCDFSVKGFEPTAGQDVVVTLGSINNLEREFAGTLLTVVAKYKGAPSNGEFSVKATDYTWHLTRRKISRRWTNVSATTIGKEIVADISGFTSLNVQSGLDVLDEFTVTNETHMAALLRLAKRIGGYCDVDYHRDVHLGTVDTSETDPLDLQTGTQFEDLAITRDMTPMITRVWSEGGGVNAIAACAPGETILPVGDIARYSVAGGLVACGPQRLSYTGVIAGGAGSLVGPGAAPASAPAAAATPGTGLNLGAYKYAQTWVTGAGETLPSPLATVSTAVIADPTTAPSCSASGSNVIGDLAIGASVQYAYSWSTAATPGDFTRETSLSPTQTVTIVASPLNPFLGAAPIVQALQSTDPLVKFIHYWRNVNSGGWLSFRNNQTNDDYSANSSAGGYAFAVDIGNQGETVPAANNTLQQGTLSSVAIGPAGTTSRKIYRTVVNGSQLKLQSTIADNTTTGPIVDSTADGSLGANAPTSDTSGLTQPTGQILPGSPTLLVAGTSAFSAAGGWVVIGNGQQVVRYSGITGNTLTGIPASGAGAIAAAITYNSTATAAPSLTGIPSGGAGSVLYDIKPGDPVNVLAKVDDTAAQEALAVRLGGSDDGIIEEYVSDGRLSEAEARARGEAILALHGRLQESVAYSSHDKNVHAGRTQGVSITAPTTVAADFKIQQVTTTGFKPARFPRREANASSTRFSLEDLLRQSRKEQS